MTLLEKARVDVGLPAVLETQVQHGTAVYLFNAQAAEAPVRISLTALGHEVVHPAVGWDGGRMVWRGTLKPGERLDIAGAGQARVTAADGAVREAGGELEGAAPALAAGKADVFNFWHAGADRSARFQAALRYGPDGETTAKPAEMGVYARRLAWVRDPFVVFQPINLSRHQRGVFAEAHVVHQRLGQAPSCKAVEAGALPAGMDDPLWANVPAVELVRGREGGTASCDRIGLAADRRTRVQFVQSREGLAARIAAEGAPAEKEKLVLRLNDKALEFAIAAKPAAGAALRQIKIDKDGWRGLAVVGWGEIGVAVDALPAGISMQVVRESGPDGYVWSPAVGFPWPNGGAQGPGKLQLVDPAKVLAMRMEKAVKDLEAVKRKKGTAEELVNAQLAIGRLLADAGEFDRARQEYEKAFQYPAADQTHLRAYIQMRIADSYLEEKKYPEAEAAYAKALGIGPGGWHKDHCETNLKKARELAGGKQP